METMEKKIKIKLRWERTNRDMEMWLREGS